MVGYFAYSIAGRDRDKIYLIIREEKDYVWLADGSTKTLNNPKRKNKKHIQIIKKHDCKTGLEFITNEQIKRAINMLYCKDIQEVK